MTTPSQASAAQAALDGTPRQRLAIAARALFNVMRDPDQTEQVLILGLALSRRYYPELLARFLLDDEGYELMRDRPAIDSRHVDFNWLRSLPTGTLGREYIAFVDREKIDPDFFQPPPGLPKVPTYLSQRMRQTHDLWHVVTGYATDIPGELALQAFTYGQLQVPPPFLIATFGSLKHGTREPKIFKMTFDGYKRGRDAKFLPSVRWEDRWEHSVDDVRRELNIAPAAVAPVTWGRQFN